MSTEIEAVLQGRDEQQVSLSTEHIEVTPYGIEFDYNHKPSIDEWMSVVNKVQKVHGMMQFYLGDLFAYADIPETSGWGESKYDDLTEATGYEKQSLAHYTSISRRFPISFREEVLKDLHTYANVSWSHFQLVAPIPDEQAKYFLEKVAEGRWTVAKLRAEIQAYKERKQLKPDNENVEVEYTQTLAQRMTEAWKTIRNFAKENDAEMIRIQVVKDGHVIEEELVEL